MMKRKNLIMRWCAVVLLLSGSVLLDAAVKFEAKEWVVFIILGCLGGFFTSTVISLSVKRKGSCQFIERLIFIEKFIKSVTPAA